MTDTSGNRSAATLVVLYSAGSEDVFNADRGLCSRGDPDRRDRRFAGAAQPEAGVSVDTGAAATRSDQTRVVPTRGETAAEEARSDLAEAVTEPGRGRRGFAWVLGSFVVCPCHLPLTLVLLATVTAGTTFGALLHAHIVLAGVVITTVWAFGLWRGLGLLRQPPACAARGASRPRGQLVRESFGRSSDRSQPPRR